MVDAPSGDGWLVDQLGAEFTLRRFMDEKDAAGLIPVSLLRWELTGDSAGVPGVGWKPQQ